MARIPEFENYHKLTH